MRPTCSRRNRRPASCFPSSSVSPQSIVWRSFCLVSIRASRPPMPGCQTPVSVVRFLHSALCKFDTDFLRANNLSIERVHSINCILSQLICDERESSRLPSVGPTTMEQHIESLTRVSRLPIHSLLLVTSLCSIGSKCRGNVASSIIAYTAKEVSKQTELSMTTQYYDEISSCYQLENYGSLFFN